MTARGATLSATTAAQGTQGYLLDRRRVFILPTRHGLAFCLVAVVMLIGAINYNNSLGFLLTFLLTSLALVSMLHAYRNLEGLQLRLSAGEPVFAGQTAQLTLSLDNRQRRERHDVCVRFKTKRGSKPSTKMSQFSLPADVLENVALNVDTQTRGWLNPGRLVVSTRFPFGLFRAWSYLSSNERILVYPEPTGNQPLPRNRARTERDQGSRGSGNDDFAGLRDYVPGDSTRAIHWKALARQQEIAVKVFSGGAPAEVSLRWGDAHGDDPEARLSQLSRWVLETERLALPYSLELPDANFEPATGESHRHACLRALALYGTEDE